VLEKINCYKVLIGVSEGKRPLSRPKCKWEYNIQIDFKEMGF
jgi:hypothetical protein